MADGAVKRSNWCRLSHAHQAGQLMPALARERTRGLHARIRRGVALGLQHRWWGLLGVALQRAVAKSILQDAADVREASWKSCNPYASSAWFLLKVLEWLEVVGEQRSEAGERRGRRR